jgi:hypothetical protein
MAGAAVTVSRNLSAIVRRKSELRVLTMTTTTRFATAVSWLLVMLPMQAIAETDPAAQRIEATRSTYHLAGYGFADFVASESGSSAFTQASFNPIFHALYDDTVLFEGELEVTLNEAGGTEVGLEYATVGWLFSENAALVAGRFLSPLGYFRQNLHPAWINRFASAPAGFAHDGAAPSGELGVQLRGGWSVTPIGRINYALYVGNGPEFEAGDDGLMAVMTEGVARDLDGSKVSGGRLGWLPVPQIEVGLSWATGRAAVTSVEGMDIEGDASRSYRFDGADVAWRVASSLELRGEYARQRAGAAASSVAPAAATWRAWYFQAAYRPGGRPWELVGRYGDFTTPEADEAVRQTALGVNYWLGSATVIRTAYEFNDPQLDDSEIADRLLLQIAHGF